MITPNSKWNFRKGPWFNDLQIRVDLGYQGIVKDYDCQKVNIPEKEACKGKLTELQKDANREKSSGTNLR